jgi:hypothetical protein
VWLQHNLPRKLDRYPLLVQLAFIGVAHDRLSDTFNALSAIRRAESKNMADLRQLEVAASVAVRVGVSTP